MTKQRTVLAGWLLRLIGAQLGIGGALWAQTGTTSGVHSAAVVSGYSTIKVVLAQQADLSQAFALKTKQQRGQYVYNALTSMAQQTQPAVMQAIQQMGLTGTGFYISNFILVQAPAGKTISSTQMQTLSSRPDVATIETVAPFNTKIPSASAPATTTLPAGPGLTSNVQFINAPAVWGQGGQGQGITIGVVDSGVDSTHSLLAAKYRGNNGTAIDHNFNWWDAVHATYTTGTNPCGLNLKAPCDDLGHGTHVTGAIVGGNGTDYQIGVAPGARFMACRDMDRGWATSGGAFEECMQFMLAPWDLNQQNADPTKAPDIVVHPYHCYATGGACVDDPVMHMVYWNLYAAGILSVVAGEDTGQVCSTSSNSTSSWPQPYPIALVVGALDYDQGSGNPAPVLASYSAGGPGTTSAIYKPDVTAPGTQILSTVPGGNVAKMSGTSLAAAHVAGAAALVLSSLPQMQGRPEQIWRTLANMPSSPVPPNTCGSPSPSPNFLYGWGKLDANAMISLLQQGS
jgi:serine protease AprX